MTLKLEAILHRMSLRSKRNSLKNMQRKSISNLRIIYFQDISLRFIFYIQAENDY